MSDAERDAELLAIARDCGVVFTDAPGEQGSAIRRKYIGLFRRKMLAAWPELQTLMAPITEPAAMTEPTPKPLSEIPLTSANDSLSVDELAAIKREIANMPGFGRRVFFLRLLAEHAEGRRLLAAVREAIVSEEKYVDGLPIYRRVLLHRLLRQAGIRVEPAEGGE